MTCCYYKGAIGMICLLYKGGIGMVCLYKGTIGMMFCVIYRRNFEGKIWTKFGHYNTAWY